MAVISVEGLTKTFKVARKEPGLWGSIKALVKREYETVRAVEKESFDIGAGELVGFIGPNGAGKTTTLKCLSGLLFPTGGDIQVLGYKPWERKSELQKQFSLVMGQKNQLWWDLPPMETWRLQQAIYEIDQASFKQIVAELVTLLQLERVVSIPVRKLSLGERMKCELVAALLHRPKVLFLDEPTIGLDVVMQKVMRDFIAEYNRKFGATVILTSHYMEDVKHLCERVIVINQGRIVFDGKLNQIISRLAKYKMVRLVFGQEFDQRKLAEMAEVTEYNFPQAVVKVDRERAAAVAAKILQEFPVADVTIEEPPIEAIIRSLYKNPKILAGSYNLHEYHV